MVTLPAPHCLKPDTKRPKGFFPRIDMITVYAISVERNDWQGNGFTGALRAGACERQNQNAERAAVRDRLRKVA